MFYIPWHVGSYVAVAPASWGERGGAYGRQAVSPARAPSGLISRYWFVVDEGTGVTRLVAAGIILLAADSYNNMGRD